MDRVVFDTNIYISSIFWKGDPYLVVNLAVEGEVEVFASSHILTEIRRVLARDFGRSKEEITAMIDPFSFAKIVEPKIRIEIIKDDPTDDRILECAITSNSRYIVTQDNHLLKLKAYKGIKILRPAEFLREVNP